MCTALYFAMRCCEYSYVGKTERKTRVARAYNITIRVGARVIQHSHPLLYQSESISVNFGMQNSDIRDITVSQDNNNKTDLNPVIPPALTVQHLLRYQGHSNKWKLFTFYDGRNFSKINATEILVNMRCSVDAIGVVILGFTSNKIGTHYVRVSLAMMLYFSMAQIYTIMLVGRWNSCAFLVYIEK